MNIKKRLVKILYEPNFSCFGFLSAWGKKDKIKILKLVVFIKQSIYQ